MCRRALILAAGVAFLAPLLASAASRLTPVQAAVLAKAQALFGPPYSVPDNVGKSEMNHGGLFDFSSTHVADVTVNAKGEVLRVSFYGKHLLEDREPTPAEWQAELTQEDYDRAIGKVNSLHPMGRYLRQENVCYVTGYKRCYDEYEHAQVEKASQGVLVNDARSEWRDAIRRIDIFLEHNIVGTVQSKTVLDRSEILALPPEYRIEVGNQMFAVEKAFYDRVRKNSQVRLTVFGCTEHAVVCRPGKTVLHKSAKPAA